jgi:fimbrial chaperone protein
VIYVFLRKLGLAALMLSLCPVSAIAQSRPTGPGGFSVAPVQLALDDARRSTSTIVANPGDVSITVQVRLFSWSMNGEEEVYTPASDMGFSPPIFRLAAHGSQAVRLVTKVPPGAVERSYRLIVDQLPVTGVPGQLQMPVRMVLPVFVAPTGSSRPAPLVWKARYATTSRQIVLSVSNPGPVHVRIVNLAADDGRGRKTIAAGLAGYALAEQQREWRFPIDERPTTLTITADTGPSPMRVSVPVAAQ